MMSKNKLMALLLLCVAGLASCASYQRTDLYFGRDIPGGGQVTEAQWQAFSDSVISRYFPEGYTESNATGRWQDTENKAIITEPTKVATFYGKADKRRNAALDSISRQYLHHFRQQSVLRTDSKCKITFINKP